MTVAEIQPGSGSSDAERPYTPRGAARELFRAREREVLLAGPAGTGESRAALEKNHLAAIQKTMRAAVVQDQASLTQSALVTFVQRYCRDIRESASRNRSGISVSIRARDCGGLTIPTRSRPPNSI